MCYDTRAVSNKDIRVGGTYPFLCSVYVVPWYTPVVLLSSSFTHDDTSLFDSINSLHLSLFTLKDRNEAEPREWSDNAYSIICGMSLITQTAMPESLIWARIEEVTISTSSHERLLWNVMWRRITETLTIPSLTYRKQISSPNGSEFLSTSLYSNHWVSGLNKMISK